MLVMLVNLDNLTAKVATLETTAAATLAEIAALKVAPVPDLGPDQQPAIDALAARVQAVVDSMFQPAVPVVTP